MCLSPPSITIGIIVGRGAYTEQTDNYESYDVTINWSHPANGGSPITGYTITTSFVDSFSMGGVTSDINTYYVTASTNSYPVNLPYMMMPAAGNNYFAIAATNSVGTGSVTTFDLYTFYNN